MKEYFLLVAAFMTLIHFWRFPHLVMENGGGAFVIIYMTLLFTIALPVYICEAASGEIFGDPGSNQFALYRDRLRDSGPLKYLAQVHDVFRLFLGVGLFQYCLFIGCLALANWLAVAFATFTDSGHFYRLMWPIFFCGVVGSMTHQRLQKGQAFLANWLVPLCLLAFSAVLIQILSAGHHLDGIKTLLYPDFSRLRGHSLMEALGHALISVGAGVGFLRLTWQEKKNFDPVETAVQVAFLSMVIAVFSGLLALPMVEQFSEKAFGANWLFFILPRWLRYYQYGDYYCQLFFIALFVLAIFIASRITQVVVAHHPKSHRFNRPSTFLVGNLLLALILVTAFYQSHWWGWWGQSTVLIVDRYFIDMLLPLTGLLLVLVLFKVARRRQREEIFSRQKLFYHSEYFFEIWSLSCRLLFPAVFLLGLVLALVI